MTDKEKSEKEVMERIIIGEQIEIDRLEKEKRKLEQENEQLKAQIEKMETQYETCPYRSTDMGCDYCDYHDRNLKDEWELAE